MTLYRGLAVLVTGSGHGNNFSGRIGMIAGEEVNERWLVQFGAAGPFGRFVTASLRAATLKEVEDAGLYSTGFIIEEENEQYLRPDRSPSRAGRASAR